ncbi:hypothetical protein [Sphaerisporangium album]|uniref:hypothetical protein n=1 Tax=Sphaerisporangium album TaxID=509200 RepID=UPI0026AF4EF4
MSITELGRTGGGPAPDGGADLAVRAEGLVKTFGEHRAVDGIDLNVRPGEIFGVLGPNGAGKPTVNL